MFLFDKKINNIILDDDFWQKAIDEFENEDNITTKKMGCGGKCNCKKESCSENKKKCDNNCGENCTCENKEPKDNEGRSKCYWCKKTTIKVPSLNGHYTICPSCKK